MGSNQRGAKVLAISACSLTEFLGSQKLNEEYWSSLADALTIFNREQSFQVVLLSLFTGTSSAGDDTAATLIASRLPPGLVVQRRRYCGRVKEFSAEFDDCDWFLCTKFHAAVAAYLAGRNLVVITYNRKVSDFADEINLPSDRRVPANAPQTRDVWLSALRSLAKYDIGGRLLDQHEAGDRARGAAVRVLQSAGTTCGGRHALCTSR